MNKSTDIYINGIKFAVSEGDTIHVRGYWPEINKNLTFQLYENIIVYGKAIRNDGLGSFITINKIDFMDAKDNQGEASQAYVTAESPALDFSSMTKKELISYIKKNKLNIDVKLSKADLLKELNAI